MTSVCIGYFKEAIIMLYTGILKGNYLHKHFVCHIVCGLSSSTIFFRHYFINGTIFEKKSYWTYNACFDFIYNISHSTKKSEILLQNIETSSCKVPIIFVGF
jgi:hypothetical protein